jgi:hypothetical protein
MVEFRDGATIAKLSPPDMRLPIQLALGWPERLPTRADAHGLDAAQRSTFEPVDADTFPMLGWPSPPVGRRHGPRRVQRRERGGRRGVPRRAAALPRHRRGRRGSLGGARPPVPASDLETVLGAEAWARRRAAERLATPSSSSTSDRDADRPPLGDRPMYVTFFIVSLIVVIMFHEFGHFATAKAFGMKARSSSSASAPRCGRSRRARPSTA